MDAEILFEERPFKRLAEQLHRLIEDGEHPAAGEPVRGRGTCPARCWGVLAAVQKKIEPTRGSIELCGLDPLLRDMVRITHLDRVLDVCGDEAEALGLMPRT